VPRRIACVVLAGLATAGATPAPRITAVASIAPLGQLVERLGGAAVEVSVLLPPGAAPENWSPTPSQAVALTRADLYVAVGHPMLAGETYLEPVARQAEALDRVTMAALGGEPLGADPHLWMDLDLMAATATEIAARLAERLPRQRAEIARRHDALRRDIDRADATLRRLLAGSTRPVVLQHPAWERLLSRYGVESLVIEAEGKEPAPLALAQIVRRAGELGVDTVFTQSGVSDRGARLVAGEIGARLVELDPLAADWLGNLEGAAEALALAAR
jgi:zinc transport system substrate-binding protein